MAPRPAATQAINTPLQNRRKATQRERLLAGMITAANREGYSGANVSAVIGEAGVSRPTFYDYFEDRDDCFLASVLAVHEQMLDEVREAVEKAPPERALSAAVAATVAFAVSRPAEARFLMKEALAGGPNALDARDRGIRQVAQVIEKACKRAGKDTVAPDVPIAALIGAVHRLLASRLRRGERALGALGEDLLAWVASYGAPVGEHRWRTLKQLAAPERSPYLPRTALRPPAPLPPGRPRIPQEEILENQRQRIMFATAQIVQERGYTAATVSEIIKRAGVDGRGFYRLFADKQEAFSAIHELGFQFLMAASAGAFFAGASWPERIWEAFRAASQSIDDTPTFAHVAFVESYAVGARGIQRVEDSRMAFTIFLQEGYRYQAEGQPPSRVGLEAIITTIFEIVYLQARASRTPKTAGVLAHTVHMALAPFIGPQPTNEFIEGKLAESPSAAGPGGTSRRRRSSKSS
jgi:AcrR family transcriptional regulator